MRYLALVTVLILSACKSKELTMEITAEKKEICYAPVYDSGPPVIVYKTKKDYSNKVPVMLSEDKKTIVWYPHPSDVKIDGKIKTPIKLSSGYLLDQQGIGKNVAFLNISYQKYASLRNILSLDTMFQLILDADPLSEMCNCGSSAGFSDQVNQLNVLIKQKTIRSTCKNVK